MDNVRPDNGTIDIAGRKVRYIDPLTDWGFKVLFGTEVNKELLQAFLNDLFPEKRISEITYLKTGYMGLSEEDRKAVFDVSCMSKDGEKFIVEMQLSGQRFFRDRALYYSTFPIQEQALKGVWDYRLTPVYFVGILNFKLEHGECGRQYAGKTLYRYELMETETGEKMTRNLCFVFLELGGFDKSEHELVSVLDKWMYTLKNLARLLERPAAIQERIFMKLFEAAQIAAMPHEAQQEYIKVMMTQNDIKNMIDYAEEKGMEKGMEKGLMKAAEQMKKMGMTADVIMNATGLSMDEIDRL